MNDITIVYAVCEALTHNAPPIAGIFSKRELAEDVCDAHKGLYEIREFVLDKERYK
jgi:hypothetical protein